jgi:hypothetical protein
MSAASEIAPPGSYLRVYDMQGGNAPVVLGDEAQIDTAITEYLYSGRDTLLHLTMCHGARYRILASVVQSWLVSTPENRLASVEREKAEQDEDRALKQSVGLWGNE